jgi:hypothetical protein
MSDPHHWPVGETVTADEVRGALEAMRQLAGDGPDGGALYGYAHDLEDRIRAAVLRTVAAGVPGAPELAALALESAAVDFPRYFE